MDEAFLLLCFGLTKKKEKKKAKFELIMACKGIKFLPRHSRTPSGGLSQASPFGTWNNGPSQRRSANEAKFPAKQLSFDDDSHISDVLLSLCKTRKSSEIKTVYVSRLMMINLCIQVELRIV